MALEKILIVGKTSETQDLARPFTTQLFSADDANDAWQMIDSIQPELILFDHETPREHVQSFLKDTRNNSIDTPIVIITGNDKKPKHFMDLGAYDCLTDKNDCKGLAKVIDNIKNAQNQKDPDRATFFSEHCPAAVSIVGTSPALIHSLRMMRMIAQSSCNPVLIIGETGTGKELAARAVHTLRHGSDAKFVAINCASLTANLLESELFGHVKGSFTSADREKTGLLELADDGTIFLDEISEMPMDLQAKLLRVIQEKTFRKVGGLHDITCKATIIASSNRDLLKEVQQGRFRQDIYYRLAICPIILAPLRSEARKQDIPLLADYFIKNSTICPEKTGKIKGMTKLAAQSLHQHDWPGNVRELQNVIERAILLETTDKIGLSNLIINPEHLASGTCETIQAGLKDFSLQRAEKELIGKALQEANWQKTKAASMLGITRATLYAKVKQYNIKQAQSPVLTA